MFDSLNQFFDQVYVLTLERAGERRVQLEKQLGGLNYTFFYGVDKQQMDTDDLVRRGLFDPEGAVAHHPMRKAMVPGHLACSLGHCMIYRDILNKGYQRTLILEDDVITDFTALASFDQIVKELPADWDLFYLGYDKNEYPPGNAWIKKIFYHTVYTFGFRKLYNHTVINNLYPSPYSAHLSKAGFHDCTHAYAVTPAAARLLLDNQTPVVYNADNLLSFIITNGMLKAFISHPRIFYQYFQLTGDYRTSMIRN